MASPLVEALTRCRQAFPEADSDSLVWDLAFDAVLAQVELRGLVPCVPRLMELVVDPATSEPWLPAAVVADGLATGVVDDGRGRAVDAVLDAWWATLLHIHPFPPGVDEVLAALACFDRPVVRWLHPWIEQLDGPGAQHLADLVLGEAVSAGWEGRRDIRSQVVAWTQSEPVVMGVAFAGGPHLDPGQLSDVLDELLEPEDESR